MYVALGSNMRGDYASPNALLEEALRALESDGIRIVRRSRWWRSDAWPNPAEPEFLNGVVQVESEAAPAVLLQRLHAIETRFGRERGASNAPRTLDLDLIAHGRSVLADPAVPHPRAHERLFVMGPLAEIAPEWVHPVLGRSARELAVSALVGLDARPI